MALALMALAFSSLSPLNPRNFVPLTHTGSPAPPSPTTAPSLALASPANRPVRGRGLYERTGKIVVGYLPDE